MLASFPASMLNQNRSDLGILNRFNLDPSRASGPITLRSGPSRPASYERPQFAVCGVRSREKPVRLSDVKQMFLNMKGIVGRRQKNPSSIHRSATARNVWGQASQW